ncbi:MAG: hypothetical protein H0U26_01230 [Acidimicrobiia bacterium]|nr:hypothetical protein [Acidimicrobiia bacterium]
MTDLVRASTAASPLLVTAALLALGLCPLPAGRARSALDSARSPELNRADREAEAGGYYEGLIGGGPEGARSELAQRLMGKRTDLVKFHEAGIARVMPEDFLQFELRPGIERTLFGQPFTTNAHGMRDRACLIEKPDGVFRIALVGSSMDMGWGVGTDEPYVNRLEDWLNLHAARRGLARRFEVLNFAVAAYGPAQRVDAYRRKVAGFRPDMVIYSATMLDPRLTEIHLCGLLQARVDLKYDFLHRAVAEAGLTEADLHLDANRELAAKESIKAKLKGQYWAIADASLGTLAADCRSAGIPLIGLIIPRVGKADAPAARAEAVAQHLRIGARQGVRIIDLSATFDDEDPAHLDVAAWDDHPNARGHELLFLALAKALVDDPGLYRSVLGTEKAEGNRRRGPVSGAIHVPGSPRSIIHD